MLWGTKKKKERAELARGGDGVIGHAGIQTRTEDAEILTHNDGADASQIYFDHYICEAKPTSNLGAQKEETERGMNGRDYCKDFGFMETGELLCCYCVEPTKP
jgi:hypothetical protein